MLSRLWYERIKKDRSLWPKIKRIEAAFSLSEVDLPIRYKLRIAEFALRLKEHYHKKFGLFIIYGWQGKWRRYADITDISQDIFKKHHVHIFELHKNPSGDLIDQKFITKHLRALIDFDGAILIDTHGVIVDSGVFIEGLRPRAAAKRLNPSGESRDLSLRFGFRKKVHTRHISAITSSFVFKNTSVFTLSEETADFHIFEGGKIRYSTVAGEVK